MLGFECAKFRVKNKITKKKFIVPCNSFTFFRHHFHLTTLSESHLLLYALLPATKTKIKAKIKK